MKVLQFPLARITMGFVLGILITFYIKPETHLLFILLAIALFVLLPVILQKKFKNTNYFGLSTYFLFF
jgi:competence protein ComEC